MQGGVDGRHGYHASKLTSSHPGLFEFSASLALTVMARPMACRKSGRLVQEEQRRVVVWGRERLRSPHPFELEHASHPMLMSPVSNYRLVGVMKDAPIAHQGSATVDRENAPP